MVPIKPWAWKALQTTMFPQIYIDRSADYPVMFSQSYKQPNSESESRQWGLSYSSPLLWQEKAIHTRDINEANKLGRCQKKRRWGSSSPYRKRPGIWWYPFFLQRIVKWVSPLFCLTHLWFCLKSYPWVKPRKKTLTLPHSDMHTEHVFMQSDEYMLFLLGSEEPWEGCIIARAPLALRVLP